MANRADDVIAALHAGADQLVPVVEGLTAEQLTGPSAAAEWDVSQVLSHLGSGAVISAENVTSAIEGRPAGGIDFNRQVWARWDAMSAEARRAEFLQANGDLLALLDSIDAPAREALRVDMGFLPAPVDLATAATFRLNEFALHSWDVRVVLDPAATVHRAAPPLLLDHLGFMLGWIAKPAALGGRTVTVRLDLTEPDRVLGLTLGEQSSVGDAPEAPDAVLTAPAEAWLRLSAGRLAPRWTPASVRITGGVDLDTLRAVFPGF